VRATVPPTLSVSADTLTERLVTVRVDEVVAVGSVGDELPPQATVTAVAMTVATKRAWGDLKICSPPTTTWVQTPILPLAGRGLRLTRVRGVPFESEALGFSNLGGGHQVCNSVATPDGCMRRPFE
jgi:hypothetical protein